MRNTFINTIIEECCQRDDIFIISGDAGLGVFDQFKEEHPYRFLNMGVAEQNMISFAAGLAMTGYKVVLYNIIPFLLYRCYEQVRNDICYQELPIVLVGIGSGITYAPMGMTHYSVEDLGITRTLPNLSVISPIDPVEARLAAQYALIAKEPVYVRLAKRGEPQLHTEQNFDITSPQVLRQGGRIAIVCHGSIAEEALIAHEILVGSGISVSVISMPFVHPLNRRECLSLFSSYDTVVSVEEHFIASGLGSDMACFWNDEQMKGRLVRMGLPNAFIHDVADTATMRKMYGINAGHIVEAVLVCC